MGEVLSQSQIDALLKSVSDTSAVAADSGGASAEKPEDIFVSDKKVRKYDFHTPKKFTKDRIKLIGSIYENYARLVESHLTSRLRINCEISLVEVEEQRYYEFNNALGEEDIVVFVRPKVGMSEEDQEPVMIQVSKPAIYAMVDRMLGGTGDVDSDDELGPYTDIELHLYESVMRHIGPLMSDAWQTYLDLTFEYQRVEPNPRLLQSVPIDEIIIIVILEIKVKETEGKINICLPGNMLEYIFAEFERANSASNKKKEHQSGIEREVISKSVEDSLLEVTAIMGEAYIMLEDLYQLRAGDILNLRIPKDGDTVICVEEKAWYKGKLGVHKDNMAVKINGVINSSKKQKVSEDDI